MARVNCPFPTRFRCMCRVVRYEYGRGYVDSWVECEAVKENGWYRFYEVKCHSGGREYLAGEHFHAIRWKELQIALDRQVDIQLVDQVSEDTEEVNLDDLL